MKRGRRIVFALAMTIILLIPMTSPAPASAGVGDVRTKIVSRNGVLEVWYCVDVGFGYEACVRFL
jgi:hypothetical protein